MVSSAPIADQRAMQRRGLTLALLTTTYFFSYMDRQILAILHAMLCLAAATPWALWHYWRAGMVLRRATLTKVA